MALTSLGLPLAEGLKEAEAVDPLARGVKFIKEALSKNDVVVFTRTGRGSTSVATLKAELKVVAIVNSKSTTSEL